MRKIKASNWIINSKSFFWIALGTMLFVSALTIILFVCNVYEINGYKFSDTPGDEQFLTWSRITLTSVGSTLAVLSLLMVNRHNKNFFYFGVTSTLLLMINGILSDLLFDAMKWFFVGAVLSTQAILWNINHHKQKEFKRISTTPLVIAIFTILIVSLLVGVYGVANIPESSLFYNKRPVLDPIQFAFTIVGNLLIMLYFVESRIIYMIGNLITIFMFTMIVISGELLSLIQITQALLYFIITISGYSSMKIRYKCSNPDSEDDVTLSGVCSLLY